MNSDRTLVTQRASGQSLIDVLERVLDKGVVIAGDITINIVNIELLTIKVRLLIASVDKAREMGIDWWTRDSHLSSQDGRKPEALEGRLAALEEKLETLLHRLPAQLPEGRQLAKMPRSHARRKTQSRKKARHA